MLVQKKLKILELKLLEDNIMLQKFLMCSLKALYVN